MRDYLGLNAGSIVDFERLPTGEIVLPPSRRLAKDRGGVFAKLRGRATVRMGTEGILALTRGT